MPLNEAHVVNDGSHVSEHNAMAKAANGLTWRTDQQVVAMTNTPCSPLVTSRNGASGSTYRLAYKAAVACTDLRLVIPNWYIDSSASPVIEKAVPNDVQYKAAIEANSTFTPVTFGGSRTVTVNGWGEVVSDPVAVSLTAGQEFQVRLFTIASPSTGQVIGGNIGGAPGMTAADSIASGDSTDATGVLTNSQLATAAPTQILGTIVSTSPPNQIGLIGDSLARGSVGESTTQNVGWPLRWINHAVPLRRSVHDGDRLQYVATTYARREAALRKASHILVQLGYNDVYNGTRTLAQMQADLTTIVNRWLARGKKVYASTLTPNTTSTDGWTTTANQTLASSSADIVRTGYNDWLRTVPIGLSGVLEVADIGESSRNSGKWFILPGRTVTDAAITAAAATLTSATAAFTSADVGSNVTVAGAGTAGALMISTIASFTNSTTVVLSNNAVTTVSAATAKIGYAMTWDGFHPAPGGSAYIAAQLQGLYPPTTWFA